MFINLLMVLLILTACGPGEAVNLAGEISTSAPATATAVSQATATFTAVPPTETTFPPTATTEPTATTLPTATFTPTPEIVASNCLICHSDQQQLIDTAAPTEEPESGESSGIG